MSQARARSFQTLNYLYHYNNKVCIGTNTSRTYNYSESCTSFKPLSFVKKFTTLIRESNTIYIEYDQNPRADEKKRLIGIGMIEELDAFSKDRRLQEAVKVLGLLEQHKVTIDIPRYLFLMKQCGEFQALEEAQHVHHHLTSSIPSLDVSIHNKILDMYLKCGSIEDAYDVFDQMPQRNLTSWDTIITWLAENGHGEDAIQMFTEFKRVGLKPDNQMFHGVFTACGVLGEMKEGLLHFESMRKNYNLVPSMDDYVSVVNMLSGSGYLNEGLEFIEKMPMEPSVEIWETMMSRARAHGDIHLEDHCAEILNLLDPSHSPIYNTTKGYKFSDWDTNIDTGPEKVYSQCRCLEQSMKEVGYVPYTRVVLHDVDQESKEEALVWHIERVAIYKALLSTPARAAIKIDKYMRICVDCHNAVKIISKLHYKKKSI